MTNSIVKFENQDIELITVDGQPMMTLPQIAGALGASPNQAGNLYTRHADEFTPEMTRIIKQGRTRVRVFNREGAWLIGMFARTPKAAAFRKWVITALAEHVDGAAAVSDDEIKKFLTELKLFRYAGSLKTKDGNVAPVSIGDFFTPFSGDEKPNISNKARRSLALSESPACSFSGGLKTKEAKMQELLTYTFQSTAVRTTVRDGEPWFVAADVAEALGYRTANDATRYLDDDERDTLNQRTLGGNQDLIVINESGLYSLILRSRKPEAKAFKKFVTSEVLPSIRKTGAYVANSAANGQTALPPPETKEEKIARKITMLMMAECHIIKSDWFNELTEELEQAKKTIKEQNEALAKIRRLLPSE